MDKLLAIILCYVCMSLSEQQAMRPTLPSNINEFSNNMIDYINSMDTTWKAGKNFNNYTIDHIKGLLGVLDDYNSYYKKHKIPFKRHKIANIDIPDTFDARNEWPNCPTISQIRDQGSCGSCWALGAVEAISDRICIASHGKQVVQISAQHLLSCCGQSCGDGCNGGYPPSAWNYWTTDGLVTGGMYGSDDGCQSYSIESCEHHVSGRLKPCKSAMEPTPRCVHKCQTGYAKSYESDKHYGQQVYRIDRDVKQIQIEVMTNGPVEATFHVYGDFPNYKSGVYRHHSTQWLGVHAVKILGWGQDKGTAYWLVANSWNTEWGDQGYFKIFRGYNECGIEDDVVAGLP